MTSPSDYDRIGFKADEIYTFLEQHGITLPRGDAVTGSSSQPAYPSLIEKSPVAWAVALRGMASFKLWEAACVLAGVDPYEPDWGHGNNQAPDEASEVRRYKRLLTSAIDAGDLPNNTWGSHRDEQEIPHGSIRAWCREYGYEWPIPEIRPLPVTDAELIERLRAAETERDRLMGEVAALTGVAGERDNLREQVFALTSKANELASLLDAANTKVRDISGDQAQGKSKSLMLRLIGGLAMSGHGIDIHGDRLDGIGQAISDMASKGISVSEQTLRDRLKEAAELIERPTAK